MKSKRQLGAEMLGHLAIAMEEGARDNGAWARLVYPELEESEVDGVQVLDDPCSPAEYERRRAVALELAAEFRKRSELEPKRLGRAGALRS